MIDVLSIDATIDRCEPVWWASQALMTPLWHTTATEPAGWAAGDLGEGAVHAGPEGVVDLGVGDELPAAGGGEGEVVGVAGGGPAPELAVLPVAEVDLPEVGRWVTTECRRRRRPGRWRRPARGPSCRRR